VTELRVVHVVESAGGSDHLWGKENVIIALMEAQRASGTVVPELVTFTPGMLATRMQQAGFPVHTLDTKHKRVSLGAISGLRAILTKGRAAVVHTHEYKANLLGRVVRATCAPIVKLVATCHGWVDRSPQLDTYFELDRLTAGLSNIVTVTDPAMMQRFNKSLPPKPKLTFIANAVRNYPSTTLAQRRNARTTFNFPPGVTVIGSLGRLTTNKGINDILQAALMTLDQKIIWAIAGSGDLQAKIVQSGIPNVRYVGYVDSYNYLNALDVYLQASYFEGLSLSLLEAMRAGLPILATKAGATESAITHGAEGLLYTAGDVQTLVKNACWLHADRPERAVMGVYARERFVTNYSIEQQHRNFLQVYLAK